MIGNSSMTRPPNAELESDSKFIKKNYCSDKLDKIGMYDLPCLSYAEGELNQGHPC